MITCVALVVSGHSRGKKWVRNPIENARGVIHPLRMPRNKRDNANIAPFDAALPYTAAAALSLAIGSVVAFPTPFRIGMPAVLIAAAQERQRAPV